MDPLIIACRDDDLSTDFLISALAAAAVHYRRSSVCLPFPKAFEAGGIRDYLALRECIQSLPSVDFLASKGAAQTLSTQQFQLLEWLLSGSFGRIPSNFSPISLQEFSKDVPQSMLSAVAAANPSLLPELILKVHPLEEKNAGGTSIDNNSDNRGRKQEKEEEQVLAYHGTSFENLHSILRTGLLNLSGTRLERTGAVFGQGVYLSTDLSVAFAFCNPADAWTSSRIGSRLRCLLVCGVSRNTAECRSGALLENNGKVPLEGAAPEQVIVVERSDIVSIRYLLVYVDSTPAVAPRGTVSQRARDGAVEQSEVSSRGMGLSFFPLVIGIFLCWLLVVSMSENWPWIRRALRRHCGW